MCTHAFIDAHIHTPHAHMQMLHRSAFIYCCAWTPASSVHSCTHVSTIKLFVRCAWWAGPVRKIWSADEPWIKCRELYWSVACSNLRTWYHKNCSVQQRLSLCSVLALHSVPCTKHIQRDSPEFQAYSHFPTWGSLHILLFSHCSTRGSPCRGTLCKARTEHNERRCCTEQVL